MSRTTSWLLLMLIVKSTTNPRCSRLDPPILYMWSTVYVVLRVVISSQCLLYRKPIDSFLFSAVHRAVHLILKQELPAVFKSMTQGGFFIASSPDKPRKGLDIWHATVTNLDLKLLEEFISLHLKYQKSDSFKTSQNLWLKYYAWRKDTSMNASLPEVASRLIFIVISVSFFPWNLKNNPGDLKITHHWTEHQAGSTFRLRGWRGERFSNTMLGSWDQTNGLKSLWRLIRASFGSVDRSAVNVMQLCRHSKYENRHDTHKRYR